MSRFIRLAGAAILALALGVPAAPARAAEPAYRWLSCVFGPAAAGTLNGIDSGYYDSVDHTWHAYAYGSIAPCRMPSDTLLFGVAAYDSNGVALGNGSRYPTSGRYVVSIDIRVLKTVAVCLLGGSPTDRLDCVSIDWYTDPGRPLVKGHIPVDSPSVAAEPVVTYEGNAIGPGCPHCPE